VDTKQKRAIESFLRVQAFLISHPAPTPFDFSTGKSELDAVIDELAAQSLVQAAGRRNSRQETQRLKRAIEVLRLHHLRPIVRIARATMRNRTGIQAALRTPRGNMPVVKLLQESRAIRMVAEQNSSVFLQKGRPQDFLAQLDAAIAAVRTCFVTRAEQLNASIAANDGITQEVSRGRQAVAMLDSVVSVAFENNDAVLREWEITKRAQALPGGPVDDESADSALPTAA
jgi:hypothetical protein